MKLGIVGLPNVGKSTLFNAITNAGAQSANYPFCTIEPNIGVVAVPDQRLDKLAEMYHPEKYTPATIEFVLRILIMLRHNQGRRFGICLLFLKFILIYRKICGIIYCTYDRTKE